MAHALGQTKQDFITDLLATSLGSRLAAGSIDRFDEDTVPGAADDVLTLDELAILLKLDPGTVMARVGTGDLPGRCFGDQWRFSRRAVLAWLGGADTPGRTPPGFGPSARTHDGGEKTSNVGPD